MGAIEHLTIALSAEVAGSIRARVASGDYLNEASVVEGALAALKAHEDFVGSIVPSMTGEAYDAWVRAEIAQALEELDRNPNDVLTADQVRANLSRSRSSDAA